MKVLMVNGSPNKAGCTYTALQEIATALEGQGIDTEIVSLSGQTIAGCTGCSACMKLGRCVKNDIVNEFMEKAEKADGFIFSSPVHFAAACGAISSFMDRAFYINQLTGAFTNKPAAAVVSCRRGGATAALDEIAKYFTMSCMPVISSQYWNMVHGNTPEEVKQDLEGMQTMRILGGNMAWILKSIEAAKKAGIVPPAAEPHIYTNFTR